MNKLRWGILGTGKIAGRLAKVLALSRTGELVAVASRDAARAGEFAREFSVPSAHGSYGALLGDPAVDAVYIATPHPQHAEWAIRAARAGKHILCEKPATLNHAEAEAVVGAARENGVFFMEAFMYRCHPQTARLVELIRAGTIGGVRLIECAFSADTAYDPGGRLFANALGGGAILDVGCYCLSMARLVAGVATGKDFADPIRLHAVGRLDPEQGTDLVALASVEFPDGILAHLTTGLKLHQDNEVRIWGSSGSIVITQPWHAGSAGARLIIRRYDTGAVEEISTETADDLYSYELDLVAECLAGGRVSSPAMSPEDTLGNMRALDGWRREVGVVYRDEAGRG